MYQLNTLAPLCKKRKRVGRGGSRGGTSSKGGKGQTQRSGPKIRASFEGGQMPLVRRLPKVGFNNARFATEVKIVSLQRLNDVFNDGDKVDKKSLIEKGIIKGNNRFTIKILGNGEITKKLEVIADAFSKTAKEAIINIGGQAILIKEM